MSEANFAELQQLLSNPAGSNAEQTRMVTEKLNNNPPSGGLFVLLYYK